MEPREEIEAMSRTGNIPRRRCLPTFQFSLRTMILLLIPASLLATLVAWWPELLWLLIVTVTSMSLTAMAIAGRCHRLAFLLAAFGCGVLWYLVVSAPVSTVGIYVFFGDFPDLLALLSICTASMLAAAVLRFWIVNSEVDFPMIQGFALSILIGFAFAFVASIPGWLGIGESEPLLRNLADSLWVILFAVTSIYVLWPTAIVVAVLVRDTERAAVDRFHIQYDVLTALDKLQDENDPPITADDIADEAGYEPNLTLKYLDRMVREGKLNYDARNGYQFTGNRDEGRGMRGEGSGAMTNDEARMTKE